MSERVRVAVCADFPEEGWPSMDRVAGRLVAALAERHGASIEATPVCPAFARRASRCWSGGGAFTLDRGLNRLVDYPRHLARLAHRFDVFHVVDHSYSHLVHRLPAGRAIVTCHDLDTFRSLLHPAEEPRSRPFRAMTRHILDGLRAAACVTCDTAVVRSELVGRGIVAGERAIVAPVGVGEEFSADPDAARDRQAERLVAAPPGAVEVLHVGSTIPRKRIDVVLRACAALRGQWPRVHLVRVGGPLTPDQARLAAEVGLAEHMSVLPRIGDRTLAAVYRRAAVVMLPSEREGFGLPLLEAMRCGTPVVASDLPVLREVGGQAAVFCDGFDPDRWASALLEVIRQAPDARAAARSQRIAWAGRFGWAQFGDRLAALYLGLARAGGVERAKDAVTCPV